MTDKTQIVVVDDHPLFREGVVGVLRLDPAFEVVAEGESAADALRLAVEHLPDLLLLDINIPGGGMSVVGQIAERCPVTKVVMLTASEAEEDVVAALKAGARGYLLKGVSARELSRVLHAVHAGESYVTPALAAALLSDLTGGPSARPRSLLEELTERERGILELVAQGDSNKEIAARLYLSEKTIKHYMSNILQKLQVRNRVEAALLARQAK